MKNVIDARERIQEQQDTRSGELSTATKVVRELVEELELVHSDEVSYAVIDRMVCSVRSMKFRQWLAARHFKLHRRTLGNSTVQEIVEALDGIAANSGKQVKVWVRVAAHEGNIIIDLGGDTGKAVVIGEDGWEVVDNPPVYFRRPRGMQPLPEPVKGGNINELRPFVGCVGSSQEEAWVLLLSWLVAALRPSGPYPVLNLTGEQGCGKSTTSRMLQKLVDPNVADVCILPRKLQSLLCAAKNSWVLVYDNISQIAEELSNAFCVLSTGGGSRDRALYTDDDENIISVQRPVILNGIGDLGSKPDLLDRTTTVTLPVIPDDQRQSERALREGYEETRPRVLGALFDGLAAGLRNLPSVNLTGSPRMKDYAEWMTACEEGLGIKTGEFLRIYKGNQDEARKAALEGYILAGMLIDLANEPGGWEGTATELLTRLNNEAVNRREDELRSNRQWPANATMLSKSVLQNAPLLRSVGVDVTRRKSHGSVRYRLDSGGSCGGSGGPFGGSAEPNGGSRNEGLEANFEATGVAGVAGVAEMHNVSSVEIKRLKESREVGEMTDFLDTPDTPDLETLNKRIGGPNEVTNGNEVKASSPEHRKSFSTARNLSGGSSPVPVAVGCDDAPFDDDPFADE